jgi:glycosyltransferase involved in cell wall biosynthesis
VTVIRSHGVATRHGIPINAHFLAHPATGSGQYLAHLVAAAETLEDAFVPVPVAERLPKGAHPFRTVPAVSRPAVPGLSAPLAKIAWEQLGFPGFAAHVGALVMHVPYFAPPVVSRGVPVVATIHDLIPLVMPAYAPTPLVGLYNRLVTAGARRADLILADSDASRQDIISHLGIPSSRVRTVYLGVDETIGDAVPQVRRDAVRTRYALPERFLLYLGGFDVRKNLRSLVDAVADLDPATDWHLVIAGRIPDPARNPALFPDVRARASALGVTDRVHFPGFIAEEDKAALFQMADAFVFPSTYEGFGLDPLEALQAGTPVICANRTSLPELMGDAAILVDPASPGALRDAIARVWRDADLRADLSARGPIQAARFRWATCARETVRAWHDATRHAVKVT